MIENNPLRQYFRRPALFLKLPSEGKFYPTGSIDLPENGEIPIYPMTAIDEITTKTPDSLFNGVAVVEIIKSCAPSIKDPWSMPNIDLDAVLVAIRAASSDKGLEISTDCPNCSEVNVYEINLSGILSSIKAGDYDTPLNFGELKIKFKPLRYKDVNQTGITQTELQRMALNVSSIQDSEERMKASTEVLAKLNEATFNVVSNCIEVIIAPNNVEVTQKDFILDYLKNCSRIQFEEIKSRSIELREVSETKPLKIKCPDCNHNYEQQFTLNVSDFFG